MQVDTSWYCRKSENYCTKIKDEIPSWENRIHSNTLYGNWLCGYPKVFYDYIPLDKTGTFNIRDSLQIRMQSNEIKRCQDEL